MAPLSPPGNDTKLNYYQPSPSSSRPAPSPSYTTPTAPALYNQLLSPTTARVSTLINNSNSRNNSTNENNLRTTASTGNTSKSDGKRRAVFCDVVLDGLEKDHLGNYTSPEVINDFISKLGTRIESAPHSGRPRNVQLATPLKPRRVDMNEVRGALMEMAKTEESYSRKITALLQDYAIPLRKYSKSPTTAIIPPFEARHLFMNIEDLVAIAQPFSEDLQQVLVELERNPRDLPHFGEMILRNVEIMQPFKKWLSSVTQAERIYSSLIKNNPSFVEYIDRQQISSREMMGTTGGFREFFAEPFQRISRYGLMIDPIIRHLAHDDPNIPYLERASELLNEICKMEEDEGVSKAAAMWGLKEAIENFPHSLISSSRTFISCIDVDEIVDSTATSSSTLRCTLFLFSDKLVIAKRPVGDRTGRQLAGLDNLENLAILYSSSGAQGASAGTYTLPGSPKKLKRGVMGFRGDVDLTSVVAVDLGGLALGLVFEEPPMDQSERWIGRPARRYVVAATYPTDIRRAEKTVFLTAVATTKCLQKANMGFIVIKGNLINDIGHVDCATRIYWSICARSSWEDGEVKERGPLALHVDANGRSSELSFGVGGDPCVIARADLYAGDTCSFSVRSHDRANEDTEVISVERIIPAIAEICTSYALFDFPTRSHLSALSPTVARKLSRPKSLLLSAAYDVFASGGGSLRRGQSNTSKTSAATTTSLFSRGSSSFRPTPSTEPPLRINSLAERMAGKVQRRPIPGSNNERCGSERDACRRVSGARRMRSDDEEEELYSQDDRSVRRHSSLPPPAQPHFRSISPQEYEPTLPLNINHSPATPSRRRLMGPRAPGSAPRAVTERPSPVSTSKRPLIEASARASPAKKPTVSIGLGHVESPSSRSPSIVVGRGSRNVSGGSSARGRRRMPSGTQSSPVTERFPEDRYYSTAGAKHLKPIERLQLHIDELRGMLTRSMANKENDRVGLGTPTGLSRSPKTTNVYLKSTGTPPKISDAKLPELSNLIRWMEGVDSLIEACDVLPAIPPPAEMMVDVKMIEEIELLKRENEWLTKEHRQTQRELRLAQESNATLKTVYDEMTSETRDLYAAFEGELKGVFLVAQRPETQENTMDLLNRTSLALTSRNRAEAELARVKREMAIEMSEKDEWRRILKKNGLV